MKKEDYLQILQDKLHTSVQKLSLSRSWVFQHDNDQKHTAKIVLSWLKKKKVKVLDWPSQSPDLKEILNMKNAFVWKLLTLSITKLFALIIKILT